MPWDFKFNFTERLPMQFLILLISFSSIAIASRDNEHSHSLGGELEHAWPVAAVFIVLIIAGFVYSHFTKKK